MHKQMREVTRQDPSGESNILNPGRRMTKRGANSQPAITEPKTREQHIFGSRDRTKVNKKIE